MKINAKYKRRSILKAKNVEKSVHFSSPYTDIELHN